MPYDHLQANLRYLKTQYSEASRRTVFFVGAGGSVEVGVPTWDRLANDLVKELDNETPATALDAHQLEKFHDIEQAHDVKDYWKLFDLVEHNFSQFYEDFLQRRFSDDFLQTCQIPNLYRRIWRMRNIGQVLTLNIDGLLRRAYDDVFSSSAGRLFEYPGTAAIDSTSYFARNFPVLLHLHGVYTSRSTWVMNGEERRRLFSGFQRGDYKSFLRHVFESYNVVFVGVNIRDAALSPIIEEISSSGLLSNHYWLTPNVSAESYRWAQDHGVRVINYTPEKGTDGATYHSAVLCSILDEVESFRSFDRDVILPLRAEDQRSKFDSKEDLISQLASDPISVRKALDARIEHLGQTHGFDSKTVTGFVNEYSMPLELSSILGTTAPYNNLEQAQLTANISSSNSSNVWIARHLENNTIAVKSLSGQALKDTVERDSFRRGVESMKYLNQTNHSVAPRYIFHTNVPMAVGMEYIQGASLHDHCDYSRTYIRENWLRITLNISAALLVCHRSEGVVLHRDLKPKNIILEGAYIGYDGEDLASSNIRFINFDMSWHKLSVGNTKAVSADEVGYYAPEQRISANADSPRSTKTDVYMLGMVIVFLISEKAPPEGGAAIEGWSNYIDSKVGRKIRDKVVSSRISRLIKKMTSVEVDSRPDLQSSITELELLEKATQRDWYNCDPDLFVEHALCEMGYNYDWVEEDLEGIIKTPRRIILSIRYKHRGRLVEFRFVRERDDSAERKGFTGRLGEIISQVRQQLVDSGWQVAEGGGSHGKSIEANIKFGDLLSKQNHGVNEIDNIFRQLMANLT